MALGVRQPDVVAQQAPAKVAWRSGEDEHGMKYSHQWASSLFGMITWIGHARIHII
jgi:hypothetical protein